MKKVLTREEKLRTLPEPIPCRWKHVRGEGRRALYRATCGQGECRAHLGDLAWRGISDAELLRWWRLAKMPRESLSPEDRVDLDRWWAEYREEFEHLYDLGTPTDGPFAEVSAEVVRGLAVDEQRGCGWFMVARVLTRPDEYQEPIYYGFPDTGYRISYRGKRSVRSWRVGPGWRVGRRPLSQHMPQWAVAAADGPRLAAGQPVRLPARIWCPVSSCGALNAVDWPESLQDPEAR